jgi:O-glycosyl hydrolase
MNCPFCNSHSIEDSSFNTSNPTTIRIGMDDECIAKFTIDITDCYNHIEKQEDRDILWAILRYHIANLNSKESVFVDWKKVLEEKHIPTPIEQANNLIEYIGEETKIFSRKLYYAMPDDFKAINYMKAKWFQSAKKRVWGDY